MKKLILAVALVFLAGCEKTKYYPELTPKFRTGSTTRIEYDKEKCFLISEKHGDSIIFVITPDLNQIHPRITNKGYYGPYGESPVFGHELFKAAIVPSKFMGHTLLRYYEWMQSHRGFADGFTREYFSRHDPDCEACNAAQAPAPAPVKKDTTTQKDTSKKK